MTEERIPCLDASYKPSDIGIQPDHERPDMLMLDTGYEGLSYMNKQQAAFFALRLLEWVRQCN